MTVYCSPSARSVSVLESASGFCLSLSVAVPYTVPTVEPSVVISTSGPLSSTSCRSFSVADSVPPTVSS